jgi:hypothetical protein
MTINISHSPFPSIDTMYSQFSSGLNTTFHMRKSQNTVHLPFVTSVICNYTKHVGHGERREGSETQKFSLISSTQSLIGCGGEAKQRHGKATRHRWRLERERCKAQTVKERAPNKCSFITRQGLQDWIARGAHNTYKVFELGCCFGERRFESKTTQ